MSLGWTLGIVLFGFITLLLIIFLIVYLRLR